MITYRKTRKSRTSYQLIQETALVQIIGRHGATFINQLHYWISKPTCGIVIDGKKWIYNTYKEWAHQLSISESTFKRLVGKLKETKILLTTTLNKSKRDRTLSYTIDYERLRILCPDLKICTNHQGEVSLSSASDKMAVNDLHHQVKMTRCNIYTKNTNNNTSIKTTHFKNEDLELASRPEEKIELTKFWKLGDSWQYSIRMKYGWSQDILEAELNSWRCYTMERCQGLKKNDEWSAMFWNHCEGASSARTTYGVKYRTWLERYVFNRGIAIERKIHSMEKSNKFTRRRAAPMTTSNKPDYKLFLETSRAAGATRAEYRNCHYNAPQEGSNDTSNDVISEEYDAEEVIREIMKIAR